MVSAVQTGYDILYSCVDISMEQLGLGRNRPDPKTKYRWDYASLANPIDTPEETPWSASIYRGLVPAKNILNHDFALNGAMVWHFCFTTRLIQGTRKTNNLRLSLIIMGAPKSSTNSLLLITHTCVRCQPIGFLRTSEVMRCDFRGALERRSTLRSMMGNGYEEGTRIRLIG